MLTSYLRSTGDMFQRLGLFTKIHVHAIRAQQIVS